MAGIFIDAEKLAKLYEMALFAPIGSSTVATLELALYEVPMSGVQFFCHVVGDYVVYYLVTDARLDRVEALAVNEGQNHVSLWRMDETGEFKFVADSYERVKP